jgi:hypothetical protein
MSCQGRAVTVIALDTMTSMGALAIELSLASNPDSNRPTCGDPGREEPPRYQHMPTILTTEAAPCRRTGGGVKRG